MSNNWNGKGLPEVGDTVLITNVEPSARAFAFNDFEVVVDAVYRSDIGDCLAISEEDIGVGAIIFDEKWVKPIKSDRDKAVDEMGRMYDKYITKCSVNDIFGKFYDAGFKK